MKTTTKEAIVYPGQGQDITQIQTTIKEYLQNTLFKGYFQDITDILNDSNRSLTQLLHLPEDEAKQTINAQPLTIILSDILTQQQYLDGDIPHANYVAGHSLGNISATIATNSLTLEQGLKLAITRGELMQKSSEKPQQTMVAILGLDYNAALDVTKATNVYIANINTPQQIILSGEKQYMPRAIDLARARGAKRAIPLSVTGAFHSPLMEPAQEKFDAYLNKLEFKNPYMTQISNADGKPLKTGEEIKEDIRKGLQHSVNFVETYELLKKENIDKVICMEKGNIQAGIAKKNGIEPNKIHQIQSISDRLYF